MNQLSALYYPYIKVQDIGLLKTALLLWDDLHYIVPWEEYRLYDLEKPIAEAMELVGRPLYPPSSAQKRAGALVEEILDADLPSDFFRLPDAPAERRLRISEHKFPYQVWEKLRQKGYCAATNPWTLGDQEVSEPFGLFMMSTLAECCAGQAYVPVTDEVAGYEAVSHLISQGTPRNLKSAEQAALHDVRLPFLSLDDIALADLVALRLREAGGGADAADLRSMRHGFLSSIQKLGSDLITMQDEERRERLRVYEQEMRDGAAKLKEGMRRKGLEVFNSKDVRLAVLGLVAGVSLAATGGAAAIPAIGATVLQGAGTLAAVERSWALTSALSKCRTERKDINNKSPVGYLYTAGAQARKPWFKLK